MYPPAEIPSLWRGWEEKITDLCKCDLGVRSKDYKDEDSYLSGILIFVRKINHARERPSKRAIYMADTAHYRFPVNFNPLSYMVFLL
ncbi:hypothetical protein DRH13_06880 [Candidatus Woesebacteria bacterium]|nr:MAG: hypothetical protein DRH13_06880 [Candidatus Woesebacteria bacterium]